MKILEQNEPYIINNERESLKEAVTTAADTKLGTKINTPMRLWLTNKIVNLIEERWKYKNDEDKRKYKVYYRNMIIRESKKVKEEWLNDKCSSVDDCISKIMGDKAYKII